MEKQKHYESETKYTSIKGLLISYIITAVIIFLTGVWLFEWDIFHISSVSLNFLFRTLIIRVLVFVGIGFFSFIAVGFASHMIHLPNKESYSNVDNLKPIFKNDEDFA